MLRALAEQAVSGSPQQPQVTKPRRRNAPSGPVLLFDSTNSVVSTDHAHVVVDRLGDVAAIATEDAVFAGQLSQAQNVGAIAKALKASASARSLTKTHKTSYRP